MKTPTVNWICHGTTRDIKKPGAFWESNGKELFTPVPFNSRRFAVEGLEVYTPSIPQPKGDLDSVVELIAERAGLTDVEKTAVRSAFSSRSCRLKAKAPSAFGSPDERLAAAAWQGLQPNGYKIGIYSVISLRGDALELYNKLVKFQWPSAFDKDRDALEKLGVW